MACTVFAVLAAQGSGADLRHTLFGKVQALSFGNLDRLETGKLITRLTNDVTQVQELVMMLLRIMVRAPLLMVGSLIMAVLTSPQLALLFLVLLPVVLAILVWIIRKTFPLFGGVQQRLDALNIVMQENLAGVRVVKAFVRGDHEQERFGAANDDLMNQNLRAIRAMAVTMPLVMFTLNVGVVAALWFGGVQVQEGSLQIGQVVAFINYLTQTLMALMMVSMLVMRIARAEASAVRIEEVLASEPLVQNRPAAVTHFMPARAGGLRAGALQLRRRRGGAGAQGYRLCGRAGRDSRHAGRHGCGQIEPGAPDPALLRRERRAHHHRRRGRARREPEPRCGRRSAWRCRSRSCSAARSATTSAMAGPTQTRPRWWRRPNWPRPTTLS